MSAFRDWWYRFRGYKRLVPLLKFAYPPAGPVWFSAFRINAIFPGGKDTLIWDRSPDAAIVIPEDGEIIIKRKGIEIIVMRGAQ